MFGYDTTFFEWNHFVFMTTSPVYVNMKYEMLHGTSERCMYTKLQNSHRNVCKNIAKVRRNLVSGLFKSGQESRCYLDMTVRPTTPPRYLWNASGGQCCVNCLVFAYCDNETESNYYRDLREHDDIIIRSSKESLMRVLAPGCVHCCCHLGG